MLTIPTSLIFALPILFLSIIVLVAAFIVRMRPAGKSEPSEAPSIQSLIEQYREILQLQEIYYPVAYRFERLLGRGQQGVVFLAQRQGARGCTTRHAIKLHDPSIYPNTEKYWFDMGRIASQISRLQTVSSPQLVSRDTYEEVNGIGYTQMEMVDGVDLEYLLHFDHFEHVRDHCSSEEWDHFSDALFHIEDDRYSIQPGVALFIMRQILRGLEALHDAHFLHSDIKPANIMIDRLGIVKVVDYGRAVRADETYTFLQGTPRYMAPELHRREGATVQSDIYSVGIVGLELLTGKRLIKTGAIPEEELLNYKNELPQKLPELLPEYVRDNEDLIAIFRKFLDPDPARRYSSAAEAESGTEGLSLIHKQLTVMGIDTEYDRELGRYITKLSGCPLPENTADEQLIG